MHFSFFRALLISLISLTGIYLLYLGHASIGDRSLIILDTSLSMAVEDVQSEGKHLPRLSLAKSLIDTNIRKETAVITYAKYPTLLSPFSGDHAYLMKLLDSITPTLIAGGSDLALALNLAKSLYEDISLDLVIYTDGGSTTTMPLPALPESWRVTIIGIGSKKGGKIPLDYNADNTMRYKYWSGSEVIVPYEESNIEKAHKLLGGSLIHVENSDVERITSIDYRSLFFFGIFCLFLGFFLHPYVRQ